MSRISEIRPYIVEQWKNERSKCLENFRVGLFLEHCGWESFEIKNRLIFVEQEDNADHAFDYFNYLSSHCDYEAKSVSWAKACPGYFVVLSLDGDDFQCMETFSPVEGDIRFVSSKPYLRRQAVPDTLQKWLKQNVTRVAIVDECFQNWQSLECLWRDGFVYHNNGTFPSEIAFFETRDSPLSDKYIDFLQRHRRDGPQPMETQKEILENIFGVEVPPPSNFLPLSEWLPDAANLTPKEVKSKVDDYDIEWEKGDQVASGDDGISWFTPSFSLERGFWQSWETL